MQYTRDFPTAVMKLEMYSISKFVVQLQILHLNQGTIHNYLYEPRHYNISRPLEQNLIITSNEDDLS